MPVNHTSYRPFLVTDWNLVLKKKKGRKEMEGKGREKKKKKKGYKKMSSHTHSIIVKAAT